MTLHLRQLDLSTLFSSTAPRHSRRGSLPPGSQKSLPKPTTQHSTPLRPTNPPPILDFLGPGSHDLGDGEVLEDTLESTIHNDEPGPLAPTQSSLSQATTPADTQACVGLYVYQVSIKLAIDPH